MNDSFGGDFNATQTASGAGAVSEQKSEGIAPVLIKQVMESPEGNFQMFGMTFGMVSLVCIVRSIDTSSTKITYLLEDYTGRIDAHYWLEEGDALKAPDIMLNNYAKTYGSIRSQGGKKTIMVFKMLPITDPNEVNTHILEVLNARFKAEEFANKSIGNDDAAMGSYTDFGVQNSGSDNKGLTGRQLQVYQAIKNFMANDDGIDRSALQRKFPHLTKLELTEMLDEMSSEGHIYSSIDPDHFLCTE